MPHVPHHQRDVPTEPLAKKSDGFGLSPETMLKVKAGTLYGGMTTLVGCAIVATTYVVRMEGKVDRGLETSTKIDQKLEQIVPQHVILWEWYTRTASTSTGSRAAP